VARHLAIDWDYQQLRIVAATVRAGKLHIEQAAVWQEKQSPNIAEAEALGQLLRERLRSAGIVPAPVLACVGRDRVILREVRYPAVAAGEEPAVIRFQVMKELTDSAHDVIIDYTPLGEAAPGEERRALVLTIRRELLAAYQALCKSAGLKLLALTPRPFGTLACLRDSLKKWEGVGASAQGPAHYSGRLVRVLSGA
jgi:Tfp pilus assembly PilM family ATPase